tara:strand:- start:67 stop:315 length:249 start_codon:yes stop_codon:yes gene_type:complete
MISLNKEFEEENILSGYKKLLEAIFDADPYKVGNSYSGLNAEHITEIIKHILYAEKCNKVDFSVSLDDDGYHLTVTIDKKEK